MTSATRWIGLFAVLFALFLLSGATFVVQETEQVILTQFGKPVGQPITTAGLHLKAPFIQEVNVLEKRVLGWDGPSAEMPTRDKLYIIVDAFGRWRISEPMQFFLRLRDERSAKSRLDDILGSEMRNTIARHDLVEMIRTTKGRVPAHEESLGGGSAPSASGHGTAAGGNASPGGVLPEIQRGRVALEEEVFKAAHDKLREFGIELLDVRFKRINYNRAVATKIFERMMSERRQIAERFRSEGAGEAAKIIGQRERDLQQIESEAYRKVQVIQGKADAEATAIYARAFNENPQAREFFGFLRVLDTYRSSFQKDTTLILTTDSPLLKFLRGEAASGKAAPVLPPAP
jgi:modulator of FtsH protease HflC